MPIDWRKHKRQRPRAPVLARLPKRRRHLLDLFVAEILARDKPAEHDAGIQRIRRDVAIFIAGVDRAPIVKIQGAIPAAAGRGYRIAILLGAIYPVRKLVVRHHMVELPCWLVEPGTPCFSAVARHDRALIAAENHPARLVRIDPKFVVVIASRSALECRERFPSVMRLVSRSVRNIHCVGVFGIHAGFPEIPTALPDSPIVRNT